MTAIVRAPGGRQSMGLVLTVFVLSAIGSGVFLMGRAHARRRRERRKAPPPPPAIRDSST